MSDGAARIEVRLDDGQRNALNEAELQRYVEGLTADFGLPAAQLTVEKSSNGSEVVINETSCRITSSVAWTIHDNREYLVDARFVEAMRERSIKDDSSLALLSRQELLDYFRMLIRGCARVDRAQFLAGAARTAVQKWPAEGCFEVAVQRIADLRCVVMHGAGATESPLVDEPPTDALMERLQYSVFLHLGVRIPSIEIQEDSSLRDGQFRVQINDLRLPVVDGLHHGELLVMASPRQANVSGRIELDPATQLVTIATLAEADIARLRNAGIEVLGRAGYMQLSCKRMIRAYAGCFVVAEAVQHELDQLRTYYPDVLAAVHERIGLVRMLRSLVDEGISIRDLHGVLEAMLAVKTIVEADLSRLIVFSPTGATYAPSTFAARLEDVHPADLADCVRTMMKETITHLHADGLTTFETYLIAPEVESRIAKSGRWNEKEAFTPEQKNRLNDAVKEMLGPMETHWNRAILAGREIRRPLKRLIERESPHIAVLSFDEITPELRISVIATLGPESVTS